MIQLSMYELLLMFNSCILCCLITTVCMFVLKMSGTQRGRGGGRGRTRKRGHNNQTGQAKEEFQGWQNFQDIPQNAFPDPNSVQNMQFTQQVPQNATFPQADMCFFQSQRPPNTHMQGAFMGNQFGSYIPVPHVISQQNEQRSRDHSEGASSQHSTSNKVLIRSDGKE